MIHVEMEKKIQKKKHYILSIYDSKENIDSFIKKISSTWMLVISK